MADLIDVHKPPSPPLSSSVRSVPIQQARAGRSGFDGGSYFEGAGRPHRDQTLLQPPPTAGPQATPAEELAQPLRILRALQG